MKLNDYYKKLLAEVGIDHRRLTKKQIETILMPNYAPENFYHDGEISVDRAHYLHSQRLIQCGIVGELYKKAMELI